MYYIKNNFCLVFQNITHLVAIFLENLSNDNRKISKIPAVKSNTQSSVT